MAGCGADTTRYEARGERHEGVSGTGLLIPRPSCRVPRPFRARPLRLPLAPRARRRQPRRRAPRQERCTMANKDEGMRDPKREEPSQSRRAGGPSPLDERDEIAMSGHKSSWQEANSPAAGDPMTADEKNGLSLLGGSSVRGDAIAGVSDPVRDGSGAPRDRPDEGIRQGGPGGRKSPELVPDAGMGDGGID